MAIPTNPPRLIFELGRLQVFHYPTPEAVLANEAPKEVFWQDSVSRHTYGPFSSTYDAMNHYTWLCATQRPNTDAESLGKVIYVDFARKRRLTFNTP